MKKFNSYLCVNADLDRMITTDDVDAIESALSGVGFYNIELRVSVVTKPKEEPVDTPDTSSFTEVGYPQPEAPAEEPEPTAEPEAPAEEPAPVEEAAPAGVTKDDVKAILREFRDRFGTDALRELYRLVAEGKTKLVDLSEDEYPIIYKAAKEKLNAK